MSTEELRHEFARIADHAPVVDVPDDTFGRGQLARRRHRLAVVGVAAVVLAIAGGLAAWLPGSDEQQPADTDGVGVPSVIHAVPAGALTPTDDLAVGRAAAALMSEDDHPVVIDADDGTYRALRLPGFGLRQRTQGSLGLSPDGRLLAWGWSQTQEPEAPSGVRIVDLETGEQRTITAVGPRGTFVYSFRWSPDSRWLLWEGAESVRTEGIGWGAGGAVAGRIAPNATTSERLPADGRVAIDNAGQVLIAGLDELIWWDGEVLDTRRREDGWFPFALTPQEGVLLEAREQGSEPDDYRIDYRVQAARRVPGPVAAPDLAQLSMRIMGWIGDRELVAVTGRPWDEDGNMSQDGRLSVIDLDAGGTVRQVGEVLDAARPYVAVDLMSADRPTVDRPEPPWLEQDDEGSDGAKVAIVVGLLGVLSVLGRLWWRRRR